MKVRWGKDKKVDGGHLKPFQMQPCSNIQGTAMLSFLSLPHFELWYAVLCCNLKSYDNFGSEWLMTLDCPQVRPAGESQKLLQWLPWVPFHIMLPPGTIFLFFLFSSSSSSLRLCLCSNFFFFLADANFPFKFTLILPPRGWSFVFKIVTWGRRDGHPGPWSIWNSHSAAENLPELTPWTTLCPSLLPP